MSMNYKLTEGALQTILNGGEVHDPLLQVLGSKKIAFNKTEKERYRILLSDGKFLFSFAMLTTRMNDKIISEKDIEMNTIICLKQYTTSIISSSGPGSGKPILIILDMEVRANGKEVGYKIGDPKQLPESFGTAPKSGTRLQNEKWETEEPPTKQLKLSSSQPGTSTANLNISLIEQKTHPISSLNPYQTKWVIKARVTVKTPIRTWSNNRGEGKLFSITLLDESGEIRATAFREMVDKYYEFIQVDKVYFISQAQLKVANKQYNDVKNNYEMTIGFDTIIKECTGLDNLIPAIKYSFKPIDKLAHLEVGEVVDVIGIVKEASNLQTFLAKSTGRELKKKELTLVDMSKTSVAVTIWGQDAEDYNLTSPVMAIKNAKIGEFSGGKNLSCNMSSIIKYNPDIQEAFVLREWYDKGGKQDLTSNLSARSGGNFKCNWQSFANVKQQGLVNSEKAEYYQMKGTVISVRSENVSYKACSKDNCNKKVVDMENGYYRCEKCNAEFPNFNYRLLGYVNVGDWSGSQWISMFTPEAEKIFNKSAEEVGEAGETGEQELMNIINEANFKEFIFKCRTKMETYNDEARLKTVAAKVEPINYKEYNSYLLAQIKKLTE